jgi:hypothetical protein
MGIDPWTNRIYRHWHALVTGVLISNHAGVYRYVRHLTARRLLRDFKPEGWRMSLKQLVWEANIFNSC